MILTKAIPRYTNNFPSFFKNLKLVAVDELHYYSGIFGSHVAYIIRRLRRVCAAVGSKLQCFMVNQLVDDKVNSLQTCKFASFRAARPSPTRSSTCEIYLELM